MSFSVELKEQMIVTVATGQFDFGPGLHRLMQAIHEAARRCREEGAPPWHYLADVRHSTGYRSIDELWSLAQAVGTHLGTLSGRVAVVAVDRYSQELTRMFGNILQSYGMKVNLFTALEPAKAWLSAPPCPSPAAAIKSTPLPVKELHATPPAETDPAVIAQP